MDKENKTAMGICTSKGGEFEMTDDSNTEGTSFQYDSSDMSSIRLRALSFESPRSSAETGDKGQLSALFYKRRPFVGNPDLFSAHLERIIGGFQNLPKRRSPGEISFSSFVSAPFIRALDMQGMDAIAKSYAASAAKAAARDTFMFLEENDNPMSPQVLSPLVRFHSPGKTRVDVTDKNKGVEVGEENEDEIEEVKDEGDDEHAWIESPVEDVETSDELEAETPDENSGSSDYMDVDDEGIDLGASYKAGMLRAAGVETEQRSLLDSCFPATGRWASVVNAARQSACLAKPQILEKKKEEQRVGTTETEVSGPQCDIRQENSSEMFQRMPLPQRFETLDEEIYSDSDTCSEGQACIGCCGRERDNGATEASHVRSVKSETGSTSEQNLGSRAPPNSIDVAGQRYAAGYESSSSEEAEGYHHGFQINAPRDRADSCCTTMCSTSEKDHNPSQISEQPVEPDPDPDAYFSFPSSPTAKFLEEMGSGHIIEEMKSAKLLEDMGFRRHFEHEDELEGPRTRAESPRGANALSKGAFGSPFPVLGASERKSRPILDKKLKFFSLERACTAALAKKFMHSDSLASTADRSMETSSSNPDTRQDVHDVDDSSSDLFEIDDMQAMSVKGLSGFDFNCLQLKKGFSYTVAPGGGSPEAVPALACDPSEFLYVSAFLLTSRTEWKLVWYEHFLELQSLRYEWETIKER